MFGGDKSNKPHLVGAKEKRARAMNLDPRMAEIRSKREGKEQGPAVTVVLIFGLAAVLATLLTEGILKTSSLGITTGIRPLDRLFSAGVPSYTGSPDTDKIIVILLRATVMFFVAGIIPAATFIWQRMIDKVKANVYLCFWGTTIGLGLLYILLKDFAGPLFLELLDIAS